MAQKIQGLYLRGNSSYWFRHTVDGKQVRQPLGTTNYLEAVRRIQEIRKPVLVRSNVSGWIYLIKCGEFYKIGVTQKLEKRLNGLKTANPHPLELLKTWKYDPWSLVRKIEKMLHRHYKPYHHHLEWFKLPEDEVARLCASKALIRNHCAHGLPIEVFIS